MTVRRRNPGGFTLLELLVSITLLALMAGLLFGGFRFGARVWERGDQELERLAELQIVQGVVRRQLARALPSDVLQGNVEETGGFQGTVAEASFSAPTPAESMVGGLYRVSLGAEVGPNGKRLVMAWQMSTASDDRDDRARQVPEQRVILLDSIEDVAFAYFGPSDEGDLPRWQDLWLDRPTLPLLVRVEVSFPEGDRRAWPPLVVAPMVRFLRF